MVNADQRNAVRHGERLCKIDADEQRADEARVRGDGDQPDIAERDARFVQRLVRDARDRLDVRPPRNLGDDAAVETVNVNLRRDDVGGDTATVSVRLDDRCAGLVAGAFDS